MLVHAPQQGTQQLRSLVQGPMDLYGMDKEVDVMIEAKAKERALLCFRDHKPIPEVVPASVASVPDE